MTNQESIAEFESVIRKALNQFELRLEQQRLFQFQNRLLKNLHQEVVKTNYCDSADIEFFAKEYEYFYTQLSETGRSYENIVAEKNLVDTYSAFEKFLFDCLCSLYEYHPKFLGDNVQINTADFFVANNIELCKRNIIELKVKGFIQQDHIKAIITRFNKKLFNIKDFNISKDDLNLLYEISLVRNLIIHNNSIVNRTYKEGLKKNLTSAEKYEFIENETIFAKLDGLVEDIKTLSTSVCEKITNTIINDANRLNTHHGDI